MRTIIFLAILTAIIGCGEPRNLGGPVAISMDLPPEIRNRGFIGIEFSEDVSSAAIVSSTFPGGAADSSGILPGDKLVSVDGIEVSTTEEFASLSKSWKPTGIVEISLIRNQEALTFAVPLMDAYEFTRIHAENTPPPQDAHSAR